MNFLIKTAQAAGTLTSADTETIIQNGIDSISESIITNLPTIVSAMVVIGIFMGVFYWFGNHFRNKI